MAASAHSKNQRGTRHSLVAHLRAVAEMAEGFARVFGGADLAHAAGLYHDLGKFHPDFQKYLDWCDEHPGERGRGGDHKGAGVIYTTKASVALPLVIAAHHGGLRSTEDIRTWLAGTTVQNRIEIALGIARDEMPELTEALDRVFEPAFAAKNALAAEFFVRMLFSCLVDADFLDTEAHFNLEKSQVRDGAFNPQALGTRLREYRRRLSPMSSDAVTALRARVAKASEEAGDREPGIYRMTVPTGGGKTLAGMGFALRHAAMHGKRRVIVAIPFTSITDQTAKVYREVFGSDDIVLEHHSAVIHDEREEDESATAEHSWQRLSAENWDAPIVVTTTVQLFQSLLGKRTSGARKLHNLADSVIILDEVQMLPVYYLDTVLDVLHTLADDYGTTILLSTATQPQFTHQRFLELPEIAPDPPSLFKELRRVTYDFPPEPWSWDDAADALRAEPQAMMVLNTKKDALAVFTALGDSDALHLSTLLCGAHRRETLEKVKRQMADGRPCRLVATQVVEAGVDLDFPVVFRAMGPLDRILQAAGRCNRAGKQALGRVVVFRPADGRLPPGAYRIATEHTASVVAREGFDIHDPATLGPWFRWLYSTVSTDRDEIQKLRRTLNFTEVAARFRMIDDDTDVVVVLHGSEEERAATSAAIEALMQRRGSGRLLMRKLQPYVVSVRRRDLKRAAAHGLVVPVIDGVWACEKAWYDPIIGLRLDGADDELLIA